MKLEFMRHPLFWLGLVVAVAALAFEVSTFFFITAFPLGLLASILMFAHFHHREQFWSEVACFFCGAGCIMLMMLGAPLTPLGFFGMGLVAAGLFLGGSLMIGNYKGYDNNKDDQQPPLYIVILVGMLSAAGMGLVSSGEVLGLSLLASIVATTPLGVALLMVVSVIGLGHFWWKGRQISEPNVTLLNGSDQDKAKYYAQHATKASYNLYAVGSFLGTATGAIYLVLFAANISFPPLTIGLLLGSALLFFVTAFLYERAKYKELKDYDNRNAEDRSRERLERSGSLVPGHEPQKTNQQQTGVTPTATCRDVKAQVASSDGESKRLGTPSATAPSASANGGFGLFKDATPQLTMSPAPAIPPNFKS